MAPNKKSAASAPSRDCLNAVDVLVVGGGPAGLTAAIYLARFRLKVRVVDSGQSRAALIPRTRNHAGYPGGIPGVKLLGLMREQAAEFGVTVEDETVEALQINGDVFHARCKTQSIAASAVLLATGVVNNRPEMDDAAHQTALQRGLLRYCPICDGYEITDRKVAVIGTATHGCNEAMFLRMYTRDVALLAPDAAHALTPEQRARLQAAGVSMIDGPCGPLALSGDAILIPTPSGLERFDSCYPALGRSFAQNSRSRWVPKQPKTAAWPSTATNARRFRVFMPPVTSRKGWIRSATPWEKPPSLQQPSATIWWARPTCFDSLPLHSSRGANKRHQGPHQCNLKSDMSETGKRRLEQPPSPMGRGHTGNSPNLTITELPYPVFAINRPAAPCSAARFTVVGQRHTWRFPSQRVHDASQVFTACEEILVEPDPRRVRTDPLKRPRHIVLR